MKKKIFISPERLDELQCNFWENKTCDMTSYKKTGIYFLQNTFSEKLQTF